MKDIIFEVQAEGRPPMDVTLTHDANITICYRHDTSNSIILTLIEFYQITDKLRNLTARLLVSHMRDGVPISS